MPNPDAEAASSVASSTEGAPAPTDTSIASPATADTQAPADTGDNTASPPDAPVSDRDALLQVVKDVVKADPKNPSKGEGDPAAPDTADPAKDPVTGADPLETDPTEDELKGMHPRTQKRVGRLLAQRNEARATVATLQPNADRWQQFDGYLRKNDLAGEDVNLLLGIGAALRRGDFKAFRDGVMPYVDLANQALGDALPADLQAKVDAGEIAADAAKELSTTRFANARLQSEATARETAATATRQAEESNRTFHTVSTAVTEWEQGIKARDPDYDRKAKLVERFSIALVAEKGRPTTAAAAVKLAQDAYDEASRTYAAMRPAPVPTRPAPSSAAGPTTARREPTSLMEAAMQGLERSRAK